MKISGRAVVAGILIALVVGLLTSAPAPAAEVVAKVADLRERPDGLPTTDVSSRRLASATVRQDLTRGEVSAKVVLRGAPGAAADLYVGFGRSTGGTCEGSFELTTSTTGPLADGFSRSGRTIRLSPTSISGSWLPDLDCAFVVLTAVDDAATTYDALLGGLREVEGKPRFAIGRVELLGKSQRTVRLVPGVWTRLDVAVSNRGSVDASGVRVTGKGRGVKVRPSRLGELDEGDATEAEVWVRLTRPLPRTAVTLTVRGGGASAKRKLVVQRARPPARPVAGRYRATGLGTNQWIRFRIQQGRITGFTARLRATCGSGPGVPTHPYLDLDFANAKIPRSGILQALDERRPQQYGSGLDARIVGSRVTQGRYWYAANGCRVIQSFSAQRG